MSEDPAPYIVNGIDVNATPADELALTPEASRELAKQAVRPRNRL